MSVKVKSDKNKIKTEPLIVRPWEPAIMHSLMISEYSRTYSGGIILKKIAADVERSGGHVHLSLKDKEMLYPEIDIMKSAKDLEIPGQRLTNFFVFAEGPNGVLKKRRILGPVRKETQMEDSYTNWLSMGYNPENIMVFESGKLEGSLPLKIYAAKDDGGKLVPCRQRCVELSRGGIVSDSHMHIDPMIADYLSIDDGLRIDVHIGGRRPITLHNVLVRYQMGLGTIKVHIDDDESNAALLDSPYNTGVMGPVHPVGIVELPNMIVLCGAPGEFEKNFIPLSEHNIPIACMITPWKQ